METSEDTQDGTWIGTFATVERDVGSRVEARLRRGRIRPFHICPIPRLYVCMYVCILFQFRSALYKLC